MSVQNEEAAFGRRPPREPRMRYLAPAGTPLAFSDLVAAGLAALGSREEALAARLARETATSRCWMTSSGRAGLTLALRAMSALRPSRTEVLIPAYTCYSVPAAVVRAGLQPRLYDLVPSTLDADLGSLRSRIDPRRTLAVISANLYGVPNSLDELEHLARENEIFFLDDAAQCLGAQFKGRAAGGFGDAGILSLERGKNITTMTGGAIVAREPALIKAIDALHSELSEGSTLDELMLWLKTFLYSIALHPVPYAWVRRIRWLRLGVTIYDPTFPIERYRASLAGLGLRLCEKLPELSRIRNANAESIERALRNVAGVRLLDRSEDALPAHVRLPIFVDGAARDRAISALEVAGIGASASYPLALCDVDEVRSAIPPADRDMEGARRIASTIVTLPVHPFCPPDMPDRVKSALLAALT